MKLTESISLLVKSLANSALRGGKPYALKPRKDEFDELLEKANQRIERLRVDAAQAKAAGNTALAEQITRELAEMRAQLDKAQKVYEIARRNAQRAERAVQPAAPAATSTGAPAATVLTTEATPASAPAATSSAPAAAKPPTPPLTPPPGAEEESFADILARLKAAGEKQP